MDSTFEEMEQGIDRMRSRLSSGVSQLDDELEAATDWREHVQDRPWVTLAAAGVCGFVVGAAFSHFAAEDDGVDGRSASAQAVRQLAPLLDDIAAAVVAVGTTQLKNVIAGMIPGFQEHLAHIEDRATSR